MWRDFVSEADGTVRVDGEQLHAADGGSAYGAAIALFAAAAGEQGAPVLVRSSGEGGETWFTVSAEGTIAVAAHPDEASKEVPTTTGERPRATSAESRATSHAVPAVPVEVDTNTPETRRKPSAADFGSHRAERAPGRPKRGGGVSSTR